MPFKQRHCLTPDLNTNYLLKQTQTCRHQSLKKPHTKSLNSSMSELAKNHRPAQTPRNPTPSCAGCSIIFSYVIFTQYRDQDSTEAITRAHNRSHHTCTRPALDVLPYLYSLFISALLSVAETGVFLLLVVFIVLLCALFGVWWVKVICVTSII